MSDDSKINGSVDTNVDVSKIGTLKLTNDVNVNITQNGSSDVQSIKEVEKTNVKGEAKTDKKSDKKTSTSQSQIQILNEINQKLEQLNTAAQNISTSIVGNGADKKESGSGKGASKGNSKNPFDGLQEVIGQAGFRVNFKDVLTLAGKELFQDDEVKAALNSGAKEAGKTEITAPNNKNDKESGSGSNNDDRVGGEDVQGHVSDETKQEISKAGEAMSSLGESSDSDESSNVSEIKDKVEKATQDAGADMIESARTDTNDEVFNELNENLKEQKKSFDASQIEANETKNKINESVKESTKDTKQGAADAEKIYKVALTDINNDLILGDSDLKTIINDNVQFQKKMVNDNAASKGGADENEAGKLNSIAENIQNLNESAKDDKISKKESSNELVKNFKNNQDSLEKMFKSNLPKEEKDAPKGGGILEKFKGLILKKFAGSKKGNVKEKAISSAIKAAGKIKEYAGKAMKFAGKGLGKAGTFVGKAGSALGKGISKGGNALGSLVSGIPYIGAALGGAIKAKSNIVGKAIETGSKTAENAMKTAGKAVEKKGKSVEKSRKIYGKKCR